MTRLTTRPLTILSLAALACTRSAAVAPPPAPALPPVPFVDGPLAIDVVSPEANALVAARDSTFVFGTVGSGRATLTINGAPVRVAPNGAFLAFLPLPPADSGTAAHYTLVAAKGADTVRAVVPVRLLPPVLALPDTGRLLVDSGSVTPAPGATLALRADEPVRVAVRAPVNAQVWLRADSLPPLSLVNASVLPGGDSTLWSTEAPARALFARRTPPALVVARGADTVRLPLATIVPADTGRAQRALLGTAATADSAPASDADHLVIGRPIPEGTYKWLLLPGTEVDVTGRAGGFTRVRLDQQLEIWVASGDVHALPPGAPLPRRVVSDVNLEPSPEWVDVVMPMAARPAYLVEERARELFLTLYDTKVSPEIMRYLQNDSLVRVIDWVQETTDRARFTLQLSRAPYGWLAFWDVNRGAFVLRLRRTPQVDRRRPLAGRTIVVDAGHPPGGATGPTRLWEAAAVLPVAERVKALLEARGAHVVMTRTTMAPVALTSRPVTARRADADAFVSVHLNAFPDGVNPFVHAGTSTLFFHPMSEPLARDVQRGLEAHMGLRDLGIHYQNLAIARPSWYPAVLTEGAFLMIPEQEAALRTRAFQDAYARGIVDGLEAYFRSLAR